jgi:nucleotide-binding universal stress UspA family protein
MASRSRPKSRATAIRLERILVPVDFSPHSLEALEYAVFLASHLDAGIMVVHARGHPARLSEQGAPWSLDPDEALDRLLADLRDRGFSRARAQLAVGPVAEAIVRCAVTGSFDLIVMSTRGRKGLSHMALGSVAERVVREAPCPVLTVRKGLRPPASAGR